METISITIEKSEIQRIINILIDSQVYQCGVIRQAKEIIEDKKSEDTKGYIKLQIEESENRYSLCTKLIEYIESL
jgi:hypothetical protein